MRRLIFTLCLLLCCLTFAAELYIDLQTARDNRSETSEPGVYQYTGNSSPYIVDFYLCGDWEYYPGMLIYSDENQENFSGDIGSFDPSIVLNEEFQRTDELISHEPEDSTRDESDY